MNDNNRKILNDIPLVDVMAGWGYAARRDGETSASYICPWHDDHKPSLVVDKVLRKDAADLGFKCFACGQEGYGAIQLAARLMGLPAGVLPPEDLQRVLDELTLRCHVKLEEQEGRKRYDSLRTQLMSFEEFHAAEKQYSDWTGDQPLFERREWTLESLQALGLKVEVATRKARKSDVEEGIAEIRMGDQLTAFDADTGEPLYRCSLGGGFYGDPKKADVKTVAGWGAVVERLFGAEPVGRFLQRIEPKNGGALVRIVKATRNYPIFMFRYPFGIKKYEPKDIYGNKWTWWCVAEEADLYHQWYGDADLEGLLKDGLVPEQDKRHPFVETEDKDGKSRQYRFKRVVLCSGPRDAMAVYSHSDAHVAWLHSEQAGFDRRGDNVRPNRWLRSLLRKLMSVTVEGGLYVCYDEDATGLAASQAIALNYPQVHWLRLPKELSLVPSGAKVLKDATDFVTNFAEVERLMPADLQHDDPAEWFENALFDTPTCQFWQWESERKEQDGSSRARYKFDLRNTPVFLRAKGVVRRVMQTGDDSFSRFFMMGNDHTYTELFVGQKGSNKLLPQIRDIMAEWLRAHKDFNDEKGQLSRAIYSAKLEQGIMESIETVDFDEKSFGEDYDHFFFHNTAVRVTKDKIEAVPYSSMKQWTNSEAILDGDFHLLPRLWHVEEAPFYQSELEKHNEILREAKVEDEIRQENMRWDQWQSLWRYRLVTDRPLAEMPLHFRFLYNTCRIFWEKEQTQELTKTEKQVQDMYFIAMLHAIGSALVRHRSANRQQFIHITDNGTRREDLASGGTGKTAILELFALVRRVLGIDGKALEGSNIILEQELGKVIPGLHNVVCLDELPQGFSPKKMYNLPLSITSRGMYRASVKLTGDDLPKFVVASNEQIDLSSDSTSRRAYQILVGDWYHPRSMDGARPAHTPADDFREEGVKEVAHNLPPKILNEARNLLLQCTQLFLQLPDATFTPPRDSRAMLRQALAASKDEQFTHWISEYLADKRHIGIPIAQRELAISLLDFCGITVGQKTLKSTYKRIRDNLNDYIRTSVYVCNPSIVLLTDSDKNSGFRHCAAWQHPKGSDGYSIAVDENGERLPRELVRKCPYPQVYYFYRKSRVPKHRYDPAHAGDQDYVQPAPEQDPEAE